MFTSPNMSHVMCHLSHVMCHVSRVTCHVSPVKCNFFCFFEILIIFLFFFFFVKNIWTTWWNQSVEGLLSTEPTPSSCIISCLKIEQQDRLRVFLSPNCPTEDNLSDILFSLHIHFLYPCGHGNFITNPAQRAKSVRKKKLKFVKLVGGGSVINGATPSCF